MSAVWMRLRAEMRARWRAWVGIGLLVGVAGGAVMATAAGARRTESAAAMLIMVPVALVVANVIAALPGRAAARVRPALVLRTE